MQPTACACCMWGCSLQHVELRPPPQRLQPARLTPSLASTTKRSSGARACDATSGVAGTRSERRCAPSGVSVLKRPSPMERAHARKFLPSGAMTRPKETLPAGAKAQAWRAQGSGGEGSPVAGRSLPLGVPRRLEPPGAASSRPEEARTHAGAAKAGASDHAALAAGSGDALLLLRVFGLVVVCERLGRRPCEGWLRAAS